MRQYDAVIIGSGLGGLECAYLLAKHGMKVCVLEKNHAIGGCLQSFRRGDREFDTGFHYVGSLGDGEILERIFRELGLMGLPWHKLDADGFDEVVFEDRSYKLANGYENFAERMSSYFPDSAREIYEYSGFLKKVGERIADPIFSGPGIENTNTLFLQNSYDFLDRTLSDKRLVGVVSGNSLKMELNRRTLPLYTFAQINSSFIQSAWRLGGGGSMIAEQLARGIREFGGEVITDAEVSEIVENDCKAQYAEITYRSPAGGGVRERFYGNFFISDMSPELTLDLIKKSGCIRPVFRRRIQSLEHTFGMFTVNIALKPGTVEYFNRNIYYYVPELGSPWDIPRQLGDGKIWGVLISSGVPESVRKGGAGRHFTTNIDILAPMSFKEVEKWRNTSVGLRGEDYREFKQSKAEECIALAERVIPSLKGAVESICTSSPLTYMNYTGAIQGSAYGLRKDCNNLVRTLLSVKTPIPNLFFTGQNLNLHGILGVSVTSLLTCSAICGGKEVVSFLERKK